MIYYLSLGSNIGDRKTFLTEALTFLNKLGDVPHYSYIYESEPFGIKNQQNFLNIVCILNSDLRPFRLLRKIKAIEANLGRNRYFRWGPREIDIDIIDWDGTVIESTILTIPHKQMKLRKFVLVPLQDVKPDYRHRTGNSIRNLIENCPDNSEVSLCNYQW